MARASLTQLVGTVLANQSEHSNRRKGEENKAGYLQPQLVQCPCQMPQGGAQSVQDGTIGPRALDLPTGNTRCNAKFPGG